MNNYCANPEKIIYMGGWENNETSKYTMGEYSKAVLMFRGDSIKIIADGEIYCSLDGGEDVAKKEFHTENGVHSLFITAMCDTTIHSVETEELLLPDVYLRAKARAELEEIKKGREVPDSSTHKRLEYAAKMPSTDVELTGFFGDLFKKGVARIKRSAKYEHHLADPKAPTGWVKWLPAATDGRLLAGAGKSYLWTHDEELREIIDREIDRIAEQVREDGYYNYYSEEQGFGCMFYPHKSNSHQSVMDTELKNFDRLFWTNGLIAAGEAGNKKAFELVRKMYDWLENSPYKETLLYGHNATNASTGHLNLAASEIGEARDVIFHQKYIDLRCVEEEFINRNPLAISNFPIDRPHCYVLLVILAAIKEYVLTGDSHYLEVARGGYDIYKRYYKHVGSLTTICESDGPYPPGSYYMATAHNGETCGSVFWVWINSEFAQLFPDDESYSAEIEEVLFNIAPTIINPRGDVRYHNTMEGVKDKGSSAGTCCEIMGTQLYGDLPKYVCSYSGDTVYINQYMSAKICAGDIGLTTEADIFAESKFTLTVRKAADKKKTLKLRIPSWALDAKVYLNDELINDGVKGCFVSFERVWSTGDTLTVTFTPARRNLRYTGTEQTGVGTHNLLGNPRYAFVYGPCLMALTGDVNGENIPRLSVDPTTELDAVPNGTNSVVVPVNGNLRFIPYFEVDYEYFYTYPSYTKKMDEGHFNLAGAN